MQNKVNEKKPLIEKRDGDIYVSKKFVLIVVSVIVVIILFAVLLNNIIGAPLKFTYTELGSNLIDKKHDITYWLAPMCYQPVTILETNPYGKFDKTFVYAIKDIEPTKLITTDVDDIYDVYYSEDFNLPSLEEFKIKNAFICDVGEIAIPVGMLDENEAKYAANAILKYENSSYPSDVVTSSIQYIYFQSTEYTYLFYYIEFFSTKSGERYLYNRSYNRCVKLGSDELTKLGNVDD